MKRMSIICLLVIGLGSCVVVAADGFVSRRNANRLLDLFNLESRVREMPGIILQSEIQRDPNIAAYADVYKKYFSEVLSWEKIKAELVEIFMQEFSDNDLKVLVDFFGSDVGRKYLKTADVLPQKISFAAERLLNSKRDDLHKALEKQRGEIFTTEAAKLNSSN